MGYVGNQTTNAYTSMDKQDITGNGGTSYTLSHAVANAQEIEVYVNNVRQEPGVAYTVSDTALSMTGNVVSSDDFYVVFQGKAVGSIVPPDNSVTDAKITTMAASKLTGALPALDGSALTNVLPSVVAFHADTIAATSANNYVTFTNQVTDTASCYDVSNGTFTVPANAGGTYIFYGRIVYDKDSSDTDTNYCIIQMRKNNTEVGSFLSHYYGRGDYDYVDGHMLVTLAAADTMRVYIGGNATTIAGGYSHFNGFRIG